MATPTKRKKPNNYKSPSQPIRSLDFFFGKLKTDVNSSNEISQQERSASGGGDTLANSTINDTSTDEDLARRLQLKWDNEVKAIDLGAGQLDKEAEAANGNCDGKPKSTGAPNRSISYISARNAQEEHTENPEIEAEPEPQKRIDTLALQSVSSSEDVVSSSIPFDENPLTFDLAKYLPDLKIQWVREGGDASYGLLKRCFILVNSTQSRIKIVDTLVNFLRTIIEGDPTSLLPAVSYHTAD